MNVIENIRQLFDKYGSKERKNVNRLHEKLYQLTPGGYVYIIQLGDTDIYKIGISKHPRKRFKQLQRKCPIPLNLLYWNYGHDYEFVEGHIHVHFKNKRVKGEWFKLSSEDLIMLTTVIMPRKDLELIELNRS